MIVRLRATLVIMVFSITLVLAAVVAPHAVAQGTILPTDVVPIQSNLERRKPPNRLQLRMLQRLPASLYVNASFETTFRMETNPYQFPLKRTLLHDEIPQGQTFNTLSASDQTSLLRDLSSVAAFDNVYRANPSITAGWSPTSNTQFYTTYFLLRDSLMTHTSLNSTVQAIGIGAQHIWYLGNHVSIQPQMTIRELYQTEEPNVTDYLPAVTAQYQWTPNFTTYINSLLQYRQKHFVDGPGRELDPFHTVGLQWQRGRWTFLASGTFLQNFRQPFGGNAILPNNNYSVVCDFEIDHQISPQIPGLQAIIRAEPVYNFHGHATPGIAGMDFRLYYGVRLTAAKPAINDTVRQLRKRYRQQTPDQESSPDNPDPTALPPSSMQLQLSKPACDIAESEGS
jgi:hypothetical protein